MQKVKDGEMHKVKADVTREVIGGIRVGTGGYKDKSIHKSCWEAVGCCTKVAQGEGQGGCWTLSPGKLPRRRMT